MRRSRLYLSLSIISMIAAVGVGIAQSHCDRFREHRECTILVDHDMHAQAAFEARDFNALARHAEALTASGDTIDGRRLHAYALRGRGDLDAAISAYHESMHRESGRKVPQPVLIDSYVGLADCFGRQGLNERAREWIKRASESAHEQLERRPDEASHYQLACVLAVHSTIVDDKVAEVYRKLAIEHLRIAIKKGFNSWDHLRADIDVDALRSEAQFQALFPH